MKKHKKLPPLDMLLDKFEYDPNNGGIFKKGEEHTEENCLGGFTSAGYRVIGINNQVYLVHRIVFYMFHRKDPGAYLIDHKNGDKADNRIHNLRRCRPRANSVNRRSKGKYVVDGEGVGRWISGVCA